MSNLFKSIQKVSKWVGENTFSFYKDDRRRYVDRLNPGDTRDNRKDAQISTLLLRLIEADEDDFIRKRISFFRIRISSTAAVKSHVSLFFRVGRVC